MGSLEMAEPQKEPTLLDLCGQQTQFILIRRKEEARIEDMDILLTWSRSLVTWNLESMYWDSDGTPNALHKCGQAVLTLKYIELLKNILQEKNSNLDKNII